MLNAISFTLTFSLKLCICDVYASMLSVYNTQDM